MRVVIYCRVSDDKLTADGQRRQDITRQIERLKPYVNTWLEHNPEWVFEDANDVYADDAKSAFKEDYNSRPAFLKLLREIRANRVHRVYVESMDRWSRRVVEGLTTLKELAGYNCGVVSIAEGELDVTSSQGWLKTGIFLLMAEWASRDKSEKVRHAMQRRKNDGRMICRSCGVVHLGRHPLSCNCMRCTKKKRVGQNTSV